MARRTSPLPTFGPRPRAKLVDAAGQWGEERLPARGAHLAHRVMGSSVCCWGLHLHVGVQLRDHVLPTMTAMLQWFQNLQAPSAPSAT